MRTLLSISAIALLAACSDDRAVTAPLAANGPAVSAPTAALSTGTQAAGKPAAFSSVTAVTGPTKNVFGYTGYLAASSTAACPSGSVAVAGGFAVTTGAKDVRIYDSRPNPAGTAWVVSAIWYGEDFTGSNVGTFAATAMCIN